MRKDGVSRAELIKLFEKAASKGWKVDSACFPEAIPKEFFPEQENIFRALEQFGPSEMQYVILGQDPYPSWVANKKHIPQATGIAFAVPMECEPPQSLRRIMNRIYGEGLGQCDLSDWAQVNKVLLLNSALTVPRLKDGQDVRKVAGKHLNDWMKFIKCIIEQVPKDHVHFVAWGCKPAKILEDVLGNGNYLWCNHPMASSGERPFNKFAISGVIPWEIN